MSTELNSRIESYEVQPNGNVKISSLLKLFQKLAGDDLDGSNMTYMNLREKNIAFVLTKVSLKLYSDIKLYDEINIKTYPRVLHGATFIRDFIIFLNGKTVGYATSSWVLIDLEKRKILRPSVLDEFGTIKTSEDNFKELPDIRKKVEPSSLQKTNVREIHYSQLDMNEHLNNTYYADIIFDTISPSVHPSDAGMFLEINYKSEAMLENKLELYASSTTSREIDFCAVNDANGKICFSAYVNFDGIE